jgi:hypothetical protein
MRRDLPAQPQSRSWSQHQQNGEQSRRVPIRGTKRTTRWRTFHS